MPKMVNVPNVSAPTVRTLQLSQFKGVDLTSGVVNVSMQRSPSAPNMIPDADGFPVKRPGSHTVKKYEGKINGAYSLSTKEINKILIHAGSELYDGDNLIYSNMADNEGQAIQFASKLWIVDGKTYLCYDGKTINPVSTIATVPIITIGKAPNGKTGATSFKPINLLTGARTDSFLGTASDTVYYLSFNALETTTITAQIKDSGGNWIAKKEGVDFVCNRLIGSVTFNTAPGVPAVTGEDNVRITYTGKSRANTINKCRFGILYGVNGTLDRLFLSGNEDEANIDYWSEFNDLTYFGDTFYGTIGQDSSPIIGYSVLQDMLVTHKSDEENGRNAFVRKGSVDSEGFAIFQITNVIQGDGAICTRSFASLSGEPLFLTSRGIVALTPSDITGERYSQNRSYYINGALTVEKNLQKACAIVWGRFYVLAINNTIYLLDSEQKSNENNSPYSTHQLEAYYWTGISATCLWVKDKTLCFGTVDGKIKEMYLQSGTPKLFNDDGVAINAEWRTPLLNLGIWGNYKNISGVWVTAQPYARSSGEIIYKSDKENEAFARAYKIDVFNWDDVDFNRWTFKVLRSPVATNAGKKSKKKQLFQVIIRNNKINEPFGILAIQINYQVGGKVKKQ